ncbi:MAG: PAS domain S-box protein [Candidatus Lokiarchaeota archaeon]|nr:PAS domain S-box protein [Candidatus Lokiarchaeota archaeon]
MDKLSDKSFIKYLHPDDYHKSLIYYHQIDKIGSGRNQLKFKTDNGGYKWLDIKAKEIRDRNNKKKYLIISRDITDRKRQQEQIERNLKKLKRENLKLKKLDEKKDQFFAELSHELRSPITIIKGTIELILKSKGLDNQIIEDLITMDRNTQKLIELINQFLHFTKLSEGIISFESNTFRVSDIIALVKKDFSKAMSEKNLELIVNYTPDDIICLDRTQITKVINNLIDNAIKYSFKNNKIEVDSKIRDGNWVFSIKDYGIGIKRDEIIYIFKRFRRSTSHQKNRIPDSDLDFQFAKK